MMSILRRVGVACQSHRKFCSGSLSELVGRPSLILPPSMEGGKVWYNFRSPLKKDIARLNNIGGEEEVDLIKNKRTNWVGWSHGWLVLFEKGGGYNMCLLDPLSGRRIQLPPFPVDNKEHNFPFKVILSHSPLEEECRAVMIVGSRDRAALCSPGRCERWSPLGRWDKPEDSYHDVVYSNSRKAFVSAQRVPGLLFPTDELEFWDVESTMVKTAVRTPGYSRMWDPGFIWETFLVAEEESGQLFMVRRYLVKNKKRVGLDYKVFRITSNDNNVQLCDSSLDGLVMFIGINHSFAVKASRFPEYKPDHIYFSGYWFDENHYGDIYDYHTKSYSQLPDYSPKQYSRTPPLFTFT